MLHLGRLRPYPQTLDLYHKTFYSCNDFRGAISQCLCYWQSLFTCFDKHTGFLCNGSNYGRNRFYDTGPRGQRYKLFVRNLRIFVISQSVCSRQAFPAQYIDCRQCCCQAITDALLYGRLLFLLANIRLAWRSSNLLQKFVNYIQKSYVTLAPGAVFAELLMTILGSY